MPKHRRETFNPVLPRLTYCIGFSFFGVLELATAYETANCFTPELDDRQICQAGGKPFYSNRLKHHIYDLVVILHAAVENDPIAPHRMLDARPGFESAC